MSLTVNQVANWERLPAAQPALRLAAVARGAMMIVAWVRRQMEFQRAVDDLERLDDRMLADVGVTRDQIRQFVRGQY